jgi:Ca-activated chloride channel homolog
MESCFTGDAAMKRINLILFTSLVAIACQIAATQTRARRVEKTTPDPSSSSAVPEVPTQDPPAKGESQQDIDTVRIDTSLVSVPVSVVDRDGRYISNLSRQDFHIFEDGVEQDMAYFATIEKPFTVVLMLDTSASTWSKPSEIKAAAKAFVEELRPDDQVMVVSFGMGVKVQCQPTSDRQKIRKGIEGAGKGLSTHLYDALDNVMKKHLDRIGGRKALVLFTDGVDATSNHASYKSTVNHAEELDALIYPVLYDTYDPSIDKGGSTLPQSDSRVITILKRIPLPLPFPTIGSGGSSGGGAGSTRADYDLGARYLRDLAQVTGGRVLEVNNDLRQLQDAFSRIADELGRQYSIGYYPKRGGQTGERRKIKVRVNRSDVAVRARDGYVYKDAGANSAGASGAKAKPQSSPTQPKKPFAELKVQQ